MSVLDARDISKRYGSKASNGLALAPTSFCIEKGEYVSVVGPSGSGKSTLMNILGLLDRPSSGQLFLDRIDCAKLNDEQQALIRNKHIGFIFQSYHLLPRLNAARNVELPLVYARMGRERRAHAERALEAVGLFDKRHRRPTELSGGEQQRVAIARAIVSQPSILLADEPTGALDSVSSKSILDVLNNLNRAGRTIVLVTHDAGIAAQASRTLGMRDGRIITDFRRHQNSARIAREAAA